MEQTEKTVLLIINNLSHNLSNPLFKICYQTHNLFSRKRADNYSNSNTWKWYSNLIRGFLFNQKKVQVPNLLQIAIKWKLDNLQIKFPNPT